MPLQAVRTGVSLNYEVSGEGEPLLLAMGTSGNIGLWAEMVPRLADRYRVIAFDNRGLGGSERGTGPITVASMAEDTAALLEALDVPKVHIVGWSLGSAVAQELALAHPGRVRSLTLGCTYCGGDGSQLMDPADFGGLVEAMGSGDPQRVFRAMWELNLSPAFREDEARYALFTAMAESQPARRETIGFQVQAITAHDTSARLPGLSIPTLVVHGTVDRVLGVANGRQIASLLPEARLEIFESIGHMFWWEQPERAAGLIREHALAPV